jgi:hypothetical protein
MVLFPYRPSSTSTPCGRGASTASACPPL